jgi:formylglycine-generating enzyme required for sulfatase activity
MHAPDGKPNPSVFQEWANRTGVILVGINGAKNGPDEPIVARQSAAIKFVEKELRPSDGLRFSMGMSGAAQMSWMLCLNHREKHAGILMMGQAGFPELPPKHVAVAFIHGDKEPNNFLIADAFRNLRKAGNPVREIVRPGGHIVGEHSDQEEMLTWMVNLERFTHPKRSPEEIQEARDEAVKRINGLGAIGDPAARFREAEEFLAILDADKWPEAKTLALAWYKAALDKAAVVADPLEKQELLTDVAQSPHLKLVPPAEATKLTAALAELRKDPALKKEYEARQALQELVALEAQANTKGNWQQVFDGYAALKARYPGTRAARKVEEGTVGPAPQLTLDLGGGVKMEFVLVKPGGFLMGGPRKREKDWQGNEGPVHRVTITKPYYIGKFEVTVGQFAAFVNATRYRTECEERGDKGWSVKDGKGGEQTGVNWKNPGVQQTPDDPVVLVSWNDTRAFLWWMKAQTGEDVRLPTEAQWEYAARGPKSLEYPFGDKWDGLKVNHCDASLKDSGFLEGGCSKDRDGYPYTSPVGKLNNASWCGAFDMAGNVWEWCEDWEADYKADPQVDPQGPADGQRRIARGGSWCVGPICSRTAYRERCSQSLRGADLGLRVLVVYAPR